VVVCESKRLEKVGSYFLFTKCERFAWCIEGSFHKPKRDGKRYCTLRYLDNSVWVKHDILISTFLQSTESFILAITSPTTYPVLPSHSNNAPWYLSLSCTCGE
jgi:hypothetical protein